MAQNRVGKFGNQVNNGQTKFICGPLILILPAPSFGNQEQLNFTRVNQRTRGGDLKLFRASYWPKSKIFVMTWNDSLSRDQREGLITFLSETIGKEMTLNDHESRSWTGVINNPETVINDNKRIGSTVTINFETND